MNNMAFKINLLILVVLVISSSVSSEEAKCGDLLSELKGEFTSPNYPNRYPHKANCTWTIQAEEGNFIHLTFEEFHVKNPFSSCNKDWVELIYYKNHANDIFCDKKEEESAPPALIKSTTNKLTIRLISDIFFSNGEGFLAKYYVVDKYDNKLAGGDEEEDPVFDPHWDDATGRVGANLSAVKTDIEKDGNLKVVKDPAKMNGKKQRKGKKGRGKKSKKSKEERRSERKLQKQKERALKRQERRARRKKSAGMKKM